MSAVAFLMLLYPTSDKENKNDEWTGQFVCVRSPRFQGASVCRHSANLPFIFVAVEGLEWAAVDF